ncbi:MAG: hypothetical protein II126_05090 [Erysipelotrichaceae bacterium]|nr:hypothetical protein [Erysipelotrichaceae bacterium]
MMTKKELIYNAVNGRENERLPYTFWTHLSGIDLDPVRLADTTYDFYKKYDIDLIKTMNNGMYAIEDFGAKIDYSQIPLGGVARIERTPINSAEDWKNISEPDFDKCEALQRELFSLRLLLDKVADENVPVIFTVFSPFTTADKLSGGKVLEHIRQGAADDVHRALQIITDLTCKLVKKANEEGVDGIFFASQMSSRDVCDEETFREFGAYYDRQVLLSSDGSCDAIHAHGTNIMFDILKDYPVDVFNWHCWESEPDLETAAAMDKCLMGGLVRGDITNCSYDNITSQIRACWDTLHGHKHILSPGCVIRYPLNEESMMFVRKAVKEVTGK